MNSKDLTKLRKKYQRFRNHLLAGIGFLLVVIAFRLIFFETAAFFMPMVLILIIYILIALIFTFKYHRNLSTKETSNIIEPSFEKEELKTEVDREPSKLEKKIPKKEDKKEKKIKK